MGKLDFIIEELERLKISKLYNNIRVIESAQGAWIKIDGKKVLNMCSNNYLGLANDPQLINDAKHALDQFGIGPGAVRSIAGTMSLHRQLEEVLTKFKKTEDVITLQSGFVANQAVIPLLADSLEDAVFTDELNHASIIDGVRLSKAKRYIYKHNNPNDLENKLKEAKEARRKLIITDGVFSMDGDIASLPEICKVAEIYQALVMVDDAHGEGVLGENGRGIVDHFKLHDKVDIEVGTLSKAFGVVGGFIAGKKELIEYLRQKSRPFIFSSALTPPDVAACITAVNILNKGDQRVKKLWENTKYFKEKMLKFGFNLGISQTPITPVILGEVETAQIFSSELFSKNIFAMPIGFPTVPKGTSRIRVMISAIHEKKDLDLASDTFKRIGQEIGVLCAC